MKQLGTGVTVRNKGETDLVDSFMNRGTEQVGQLNSWHGYGKEEKWPHFDGKDGELDKCEDSGHDKDHTPRDRMNLWFKFLYEAIGRKVQINRAAPDKLNGRLVAVGTDYISLKANEGPIIYVTTRHIITISWGIVDEIPIANPFVEKDSLLLNTIIEADDFHDLLSKLRLRLVQVNSGGSKVLTGVLIGVQCDSATVLYDNRELVRLPLFHIKSVRPYIGGETPDSQ